MNLELGIPTEGSHNPSASEVPIEIVMNNLLYSNNIDGCLAGV